MKWVKKPTRVQLTIFYVSLMLLSFITGQVFDSEEVDWLKRIELWLTQEAELDHPQAPILSTDDPELTVHFIDVGQGDATLLVGHNFTILIDAGRHDGNEVVPYLEQQQIKQLDLVVGTHPHADHIGQLADVIEQFEVQEVWMSGETHSSRTFERVLDAIAQSGAAYYEPRAGESFQIGDAQIDVVSPHQLVGDLNESSISMRIQFGQVSFLFTGDAEEGMEQEMLKSGYVLQSDVFHLGHHGSSTSNTEKFLKAVQPKVAIYSAGLDNSYGHPHTEVIERLIDFDIPFYGTEQYGTIKVVTDGNTFDVTTE